MSDYLWDKSGQPDAEIAELERLLRPLGWKEKRRVRWAPIAMAASILIACGVAGWFAYPAVGPAWRVAGSETVKRLAKGQTIRTSATSRAKLQLDGVGEVEVEPNTSLSVVSMKSNNHRLNLERGVIHAFIWAPPREFYVNTPSAVTVDLGCAYTLEVDAQGIGLVHVSMGWVAFEDKGRQSLVPAYASCRTWPGRGPGLPFYEDASKDFQKAVTEFDLAATEHATAAMVGESRTKDALTLWHLLQRVPVERRGAVYDRIAQVIAIPLTVTRKGIVAGDHSMNGSLWDSLGVGNRSLYLAK